MELCGSNAGQQSKGGNYFKNEERKDEILTNQIKLSLQKLEGDIARRGGDLSAEASPTLALNCAACTDLIHSKGTQSGQDHCRAREEARLDPIHRRCGLRCLLRLC